MTATPRPDYTEGLQGVRLSRVATLMLGASLAAGCHNPVAPIYGGPPSPAPTTDAGQAIPQPPPVNAPVYGGPPPVFDAAAPTPDVARAPEPVAVPAYGAPPPPLPTPTPAPTPRRRR